MASQFLDGQVSLDSLGTMLVVPVAGFNRFSCDIEGDMSTGVLSVYRQVNTGSDGLWDFDTPLVLNSSTQNHFRIDTQGVGAVVFVVTTAVANKTVKINTLAELVASDGGGGSGPAGPAGPAGPLTRIPVRSMLGPLSGSWWENGGLTATAHGALTGASNRMEIAPVIFPVDFTVDRIASRCTTGVAASEVKLIVYAAGSDGWPTTLIHETAAMSTATTNTSQIETWSNTFTAGVTYWVGVRHSSNAGMRAIPVAATPSLGLVNETAANNFTTLRRTLTFATAAPATWGFNASELTANIAPTAIRFRAV